MQKYHKVSTKINTIDLQQIPNAPFETYIDVTDTYVSIGKIEFPFPKGVTTTLNCTGYVHHIHEAVILATIGNAKKTRITVCIPTYENKDDQRKGTLELQHAGYKCTLTVWWMILK